MEQRPPGSAIGPSQAPKSTTIWSMYYSSLTSQVTRTKEDPIVDSVLKGKGLPQYDFVVSTTAKYQSGQQQHILREKFF